MIEEWTFSREQANHFRQWLDLSRSDLKWTDEHVKNFDDFWELFFHPPMQLKDIHEKFSGVELTIKTGTLRQWVRWLRDRFNCYLFVHEHINLRDLALDSNYRINDLAYVLRNFLIGEYPEKKDELDKFLNIGNYLSENLYVSFEELKNKIGIIQFDKCQNHNDLMNTLEVPLFKEFPLMTDSLRNTQADWREKSLLRKFIVFKFDTLKYIALFALIGFLLVWGIKNLREWNDWYLSERIKITVPSFYDEDLLEKTLPVIPNKEVISGIADKLSTNDLFESSTDSDERESAEDSDIVITSLQNIQKTIKTAEYESSEYEETQKGGFRDYRYGGSRAYRLMINSMEPDELAQKISLKLKSIKHEQVDNVALGKEIPGGRYYNLYIDNNHVSEFLESFDDKTATFYTSKTPAKSPKGMSHLFIWIKEI